MFEWLLMVAISGAAPVIPPDVVPARVAVERALDDLPAASGRAEWTPRRLGLVDRDIWSIHLDALPGYANPVALVDAKTGVLLAVEDQVMHARARVYPHNPLVDADPIEVELPAEADVALSDDRMELLQCRDLGATSTLETPDGDLFDVRECTEVVADGPVAGDYLFDPVPWPQEPTLDEDDFAVANLYWNVHRGLDWFEAIGWVPDPAYDPRLEVVANRRVTDMRTEQTATDPGAALDTYNNAYHQRGWMDVDGIWTPPRLVFGQGDVIDYAYDADVAHHELTHAIVSSLGTLGMPTTTPHGPSMRSAALNEGLADYFSCAIQGDPALGEYAGDDREHVRHLIGDLSCAGDLTGEMHDDGLIFAQALWEIRDALSPDDQARMDAAVLEAIPILAGDPSFEASTVVIADLLDDQVSVHAGDLARAVFAERGLDDCPPIVPVVPDGEQARELTLIQPHYWWDSLKRAPGYVQFVVDVPHPGSVLVVSGIQYESLKWDPLGTYEPQPIQLVGQSGSGIVWEQELVEGHGTLYGYPTTFQINRWKTSAKNLGDLERVASEPWDEDPEWAVAHTYEIRFVVSEAGPFVFQLANQYERPVYLADLTVDLVEPLSAQPMPATSSGKGCGCDSSGSVPAGSLLAVLLMVLRRRE